MLAYLFSLYLLCSAIAFTDGQQYFQHRGDHYDARVAIRRMNPQYPDAQLNQAQVRQRLFKTNQAHRPWRQGDRVTKEEIAQNLARALLARKKTSSEIQAEKRKSNEEQLRAYTWYQAMIRKGSQPQRPPSKPNPIPVQASYNPNPEQVRVQGQPRMRAANRLPQQGQAQRGNTPQRLNANPREFMKPNSFQA